MENKQKRVIDLGIIPEEELSGVKKISLVEEPAIELDFLYFNKEAFVTPNAGESDDEFLGRCIPYVINEGKDEDQAAAICYSYLEGFAADLPHYTKDGKLWTGPTHKNADDRLMTGATHTADSEYLYHEDYFESYNDYPESAKNAAKRALAWRDAHPDQGCGTPVGWARANQLAKSENISEETIARMASFARHLQYKDVPYSEGCGGLMVDAWGGQAGIEWASNKLEEIREKFDIDTTSLTPYVDPGIPKKKIEDILTPSQIETILEMASVLGVHESEVDYVSAFKFAINPKDGPYTPARTITKADGVEELYKYRSSSVAGNSRRFCSRMMGLSRFYSREEIDALDTFNEGFGPGVGGGQYSIFKYKGGVNCQHYWQKYLAQRIGKRLQVTEATPTDSIQQMAETAPRTLQGRGYVKRPERNLTPLAGHSAFQLNFADEEQKVVVGPAMLPNISILRKDEDGEPYYVKFTEETIAEIARKYMKEARTNDVNTDHEVNNAGSYVFETWIVEDPKTDKANTVYGYNVPKGTWMVKMKVDNPETWRRIKAGELKGLSVEGSFSDLEEIQARKAYEKIKGILR